MKFNVHSIALAACLAFASGAQGQGLLSIGSDDDFYSALPFTTAIGMSSGWDSNINSSSIDPVSSAFIRGGIDMAYGSPSRTTPVKFGLGASANYYFDQAPGQDDDVLYDIRFTLNASHSFSRRLTVGSNTYAAYEYQPNYAIGAADQSRLDQYFYGYESLWVSYEMSRRWSLITRYTIDGIHYDNSDVGYTEDRLTQTVGPELRYMLDRRNTIVGEYRYTYTDYADVPRDYQQSIFLLGLDHDFSRTLVGSFRAGAEIRDWESDLFDDDTKPYVEAALRQRVNDTTEFTWLNRVGMEDSELYSYDDRYTFRSVFNLSHQFTSRLRGNIGFTYIYDDYQDSPFVPDTTDNQVSVGVGVGYRLFQNIDLTADYTYTGISSDVEFREYDRNRVSMGLTAEF